jgi:hypothetical protein
MGHQTKKFEESVPAYIRDLGVSNNAPLPKQFVPSAEAGIDQAGPVELSASEAEAIERHVDDVLAAIDQD